MIGNMLNKWASNFSILNWDRIHLSRLDERIKIDENTITQTMVYDLHQSGIREIKIYEAEDETINGNDLDVFIQNYDNTYYKYFAVQAKKVYPGDKYKKLSHKVNGRYQISNIIRYANSSGAIPMYFMYSYSDKYSNHQTYKGKYLYNEFGVAVICARDLFWKYFNPFKDKFIKIPSVSDIVEDSSTLTFREFLCDFYEREKMIFNIFDPTMFAGTIFKRKIKEYSINEILQINGWKSYTGLSGKIKKSNQYIESTNFNPRYRIIINSGDNI